MLLCAGIAFAARFMAGFIPMVGAVTMAIILGVVVANVARLPRSFVSGIQFSEKKILSVAIMLIGLKLQLNVVKDLGLEPLILVLGIQAATFATAIIAGRLLGFGKVFSVLMGTGNAVCGSSAIAAAAPVLKADESSVGISIGVVNLMGTIGIFLLPALAHVLHYDQVQGGYFTGGILQAVGQVVAAGFSLGEQAGTLATLVKMLRVLMLGPIVLILSMMGTTSEAGSKRNVSIPPFIVGFFVCSIAATIWPQDVTVIPILKTVSKMLLVVAMAAIGMKIQFADLLRQGPKALLLGGIIFCMQIVVTISLLAMW